MQEAIIDPQDWELLKSVTDSDSLAELLEIYLHDSPALIDQLRFGLGAGNRDAVQRAACRLETNSAGLGARRMAGAARDLARAARAGSLLGAQSDLVTVEVEYARLASWLVNRKEQGV